jgi:hypothetical protein
MRGPMREDQEAVYRNNSADSDHDNIRVVAPHSLVDCPVAQFRVVVALDPRKPP